MCIFMCMYICMYMHIYVDGDKERERVLGSETEI